MAAGTHILREDAPEQDEDVLPVRAGSGSSGGGSGPPPPTTGGEDGGDGIALLAGLALAGAGYLYYQRRKT